MRRIVALPFLALAVAFSPAQQPTATPLVAIFVVDGLRPDSISAVDTPTIARLRDNGVEYVNSHSVFPTSTRVNATTLATGVYPMRHGIVGNSMYVEGVDARRPFDTGDYLQLLQLEKVSGRAADTETLGERLQRAGRTLVTASSGTTGNGFLLNPQGRHGAGVTIHGLFDRGRTAAFPERVSDTIIQRFGSPPPDPDDLGQMRWTDTVVRDYVLPELRPDVLIDWMGPLDSAQHAHGVGSREARDALRAIDDSLARTLDRISTLGLAPRMNIIITSDHGFAHHTEGVDVTKTLVDAQAKQRADSTDVIVASQGQSVLFYVPTHDSDRITQVVRALQRQPWTDVVFTRGGNQGLGSVSGTFSYDLIAGAHPSRGADVAISLAWSSRRNAYGVPGGQTINSAASGPIAGDASGHGGLSPWVVQNTLVASGPAFEQHARILLPAALADIAPTVLTMLGVDVPQCGRGCGRVLAEALRDGPAAERAKATTRTLTAREGRYRASIQISSVAGHDYVDKGWRDR